MVGMHGREYVSQRRAGNRFPIDPGRGARGRPVAHAHDRRGNVRVIQTTGSVRWW